MTVPNSVFLKIVGVACILIGLVEIGVGSEVWAFVPGVKYGSWWAAMIVVASGIVALIANNKFLLQLMTFLSAIASILSFSGMLVDSFGYRRVNELETCVNNVTGEYSGASGLQPEAAQCAVDYGKLCGCVGDNGVCHNFDINKYRQQNCELILTKYTDLLLVSLVFSAFCLAWVFLLSIMGCVTLSKLDVPPDSARSPVQPPMPLPTSEPAAPVSTGAVQLTTVPASATAGAGAEENPDSPL